MKLLLDENLSYRLVALLQGAFPESEHVRSAGLLGAPDPDVWAYAAGRGFVLVSKDVDFYHRSLVLGPPPQVIWLRIGNAPTADIAALLLARLELIERFAADPTAAFLVLPAEE